MTPDNIVDIVRGLVDAQNPSNNVLVILPIGSDLHVLNDKGESLLNRLMAIDGVKEVTVGNGKGVSIMGHQVSG